MIACNYWQISKYKVIEIQLSRWPDARLFDVELIVMRHDHKGFDLAVTLFRYEFRLAFYDTRHAE